MERERSDSAPRLGLVLTRKVGETIKIGDDITITVAKIRGTSQVRLRFECPEETRIMRGELLTREGQS